MRQKLFLKWGAPSIDIFATRQSAVVRRCVSLDTMDQQAFYTNAFSQRWQYRLAWVFPPPSLIPRIAFSFKLSRGDYHLNRNSVGNSHLASWHQIKGYRSSISCTQPSTSPVGPRNETSSTRNEHVDFGVLEDSGWTTQLCAWWREDIELIRSSWRASTLKSYKAAWCHWEKMGSRKSTKR